MQLSKIIKKPLITEKTVALADKGKFVFIVDRRADKLAIKKAVEEFFNVEVKRVWTIRIRGKVKRVGKFRNKSVKQPDKKKAIVKLAKGQKIDLFEVKEGS